jgi:calmodulin
MVRKQAAGVGVPAAATPESLVAKNAKGGVLVTKEEIKAAFEFFDVDGRGVITSSALRRRLGAFKTGMTAKQCKFLMNNKSEMTIEDLEELLLENEVTDFDPVKEAFRAYDPDGTGFVDTNVLRAVFQKLGFGEISQGDLEILVDAADMDGDGKISLDDFRKMMQEAKPPPQTDTATELECEAEQEEGAGDEVPQMTSEAG